MRFVDTELKTTGRVEFYGITKLTNIAVGPVAAE